jgi:Leucine-rich repeat (LRR) protein
VTIIHLFFTHKFSQSMKYLILHFSLLFACFIHPFIGSSQTINTQDSLALVDLYNSTNGSGWINRTNWLTTAPLSTWYGVSLTNGRVTSLNLNSNKVIGSLPSSLGNLTALNLLLLANNQISGNIPASFGNLTQSFTIDLSNNQLSGRIPSSLNTLPSFSLIHIYSNRFTFAGMEEFTKNPFNKYSPQADIPLIQNGNILSVAVGGTPTNNTFKWYKDNVLISTKTSDSTLTITSTGDYSVTVTNTIASNLTLYSISTANTQDSLALVDLYNSTNGSGWINRTNWLTTAPLSTWYGVTVRDGRVKELSLTNNDLTGRIPTSIGNLAIITDLNLSNNHLNGTIPSSLGALSKLIRINFPNNQLTGSIPDAIGNLSSLSALHLGNNQLTGHIPEALSNLSNLSDLYLNNNQLTGSVPVSFGNLSNLYWLQASNNQLSGTIPASLGRLSKLTGIELYNNQLTGSIPDSLSYLSKLGRLELFNNQLTGRIPDSLGNLTQLFSLLLNNNSLSGPIPSLIKLKLNSLHLQNNQFTFAGMEQLPSTFSSTVYTPQASISLNRRGSRLSVAAGGTLSNNTFRLYRDGVLSATQTGDSSFTIAGVGKYNITVNNAIATQLTLTSETVTLSTMLADTTVTIVQEINGTTPIDVNDGIMKLVNLTPTAGNNQLSGSVTTTVAIDTVVNTYQNQPYVQRHYDITPATNAANAQATVTLYYTQQEFDNYNAYVTSHNLNIPLLPTNGVNNGNIHIIQFHGTFAGTSDPANYNSEAVLIIPSVVWDDTNHWWVVTFPVNGFSGFFLTTGNIVLPITLLEFKGNARDHTVKLQWLTANETHTKQFAVERSSNGAVFESIGKVAALSITGTHSYNFTDANPLAGNNFYRLKMLDLDGKFAYSQNVNVQINTGHIIFSAYPNPTHATASVIFAATTSGIYQIEVADLSGKVITQLSGTSVVGVNEVIINMHNYTNGTYIITLVDAEHSKRSIKLSKQ